MSALTGSIALAILIAPVALAGTVNFDDRTPGERPHNCAATMTGSGTPRWTVERDETAPSPPYVLKQSGEATYPLCLQGDSSIKDGFVEVKFKAVGGKADQAGGVVWRASDANNYYVARANALEDSVTIYHTIKGRRIAFKEAHVKVESGVWHTLRAEFRGDSFMVAFDGRRVIDATDTSIPTAGKVGLWTKADSVTVFDDFSFGKY